LSLTVVSFYPLFPPVVKRLPGIPPILFQSASQRESIFYTATVLDSVTIWDLLSQPRPDYAKSAILFDPGPIFRFRKGLSLITRVAFETAGRYGFCTVLAKAFSPAKKNSLFVAVGMPVRFGNNLPASIGATFFFGIAFK
jgi:hypothetical protein